MGKNQTYKAMQRARHGGASGGNESGAPGEEGRAAIAPDGMVSSLCKCI